MKSEKEIKKIQVQIQKDFDSVPTNSIAKTCFNEQLKLLKEILA